MNFSDWFRLKRSDEIVPEGGIVPDRESYFDMAAQAPPSSARVVSVNSPDLAMKIAAVFRCIDILSAGVASLPFEYKRYNRAEGYFVDYYESNLYYLLTVQANPRMTAYEFMRNIIIEKVTRGNAYVFPKMVGGDLDELILCSPHSVSFDKYLNTYTITDFVNGVFGTYRADQIIHLRNFSLDGGYTGVSTITYAASVLGISATADKETLSAFATGGRMKGLVSNDNSVAKGFGELQDGQLKTAAKILDQAIKSGDDIISVPGDAKFSTMSISQKDMELLESKKFGVLEICRFFGVHPDKVFAGQSANYKASEMSQVSFLTDTLAPTLRQIEMEFFAKLIDRDFYRYYKFEFDKSSIYTTDLATEGVYMTTTLSNGVMTVNDWRRKKDLKPVEGGDQIFISCNVAPINSPKISGETESAANFQSNNSNEKDNGKKHEIRTYSDAVNVQVRAAEEGRPEIIEGYAIVFGSRSNLIYDFMVGKRLYETIERGAVAQADLDQWDVRATLDHDFTQLLARSVEGKGSLRLTVDDHGVKYSFDVPDTIDGKRAAERVKRGELFGSSFMFSFDEKKDCTYSRDADGNLCRSVKKIGRIYDISIVQNPAYQASSVSRRSMEDAGVIEPEDNHVAEEVAAMRKSIEQIY